MPTKNFWLSIIYLKLNSVASGEKLGFQITLLLASYFYFDFFQNQLPPFEKTTDTPMALIFFMVIIINQFGTIIGSFIAFERPSQFESYHFKDTIVIFKSCTNADSKSFGSIGKWSNYCQNVYGTLHGGQSSWEI